MSEKCNVYDRNSMKTLFIVSLMFGFLMGFIVCMSINETLHDFEFSDNDGICSDLFSKVKIDNLNIEVNYTAMMDWMESKGYELGCKT